MECQKDCMTLQQDLHTQAVWERKWGMEFHPQKCSVLTITRSTSPISHSYQLKRYVLEHQDTAKYLTVFLSWKNHIDRVCKKANSTLGFPRCNIRKLNFGQAYLGTYAPYKSSGQPAHSHRLIRFFTVINNDLKCHVDKKDSNQTTQMRRLI